MQRKGREPNTTGSIGEAFLEFACSGGKNETPVQAEQRLLKSDVRRPESIDIATPVARLGGTSWSRFAGRRAEDEGHWDGVGEFDGYLYKIKPVIGLHFRRLNRVFGVTSFEDRRRDRAKYYVECDDTLKIRIDEALGARERKGYVREATSIRRHLARPSAPGSRQPAGPGDWLNVACQTGRL